MASTLSGRGRGMGPLRPSCAMIFVPPHGNMHLSALGIGFVALAWHTWDHRAPCDHRACSACSWQTELWSPRRVQCSQRQAVGRHLAWHPVTTGQTLAWHTWDHRLAVHAVGRRNCGARIGYSVRECWWQGATVP